VAPDLLQLLAQLGALPADQRAFLAKLLNPSAANVGTSKPLDDSLSREFENPKGE
jgi:hypothetical protein